MLHILSICMLIYLVLKALIELTETKSGQINCNAAPSIKFTVNGNEIDATHTWHSLDKLNLLTTKNITPEIISEHYQQLFEEIIEQRKTQLVKIDIAELRAAKQYLLDKWKYVANEN